MKNFIIFCMMGVCYVCIEVFFSAISDALNYGSFRLVGASSIWMFCEGGLLGIVISGFNNQKKTRISYPFDILLGGLFITLCELLSGLLLNKLCGFNIWDYSQSTYNFLGQIDLLHSVCWLLLTPVILWVDDVIRFYVFGEKRPQSVFAYYIRDVE